MHTQPTQFVPTVLAYRHSGVCGKLVAELGYTTEAAEQLFQDTLRFLALAGDPHARAMTMTLATEMGYTVNRTHVCVAPTRAIDEAWHRFVLFTHDYTRFCAERFGKFLHHQPIASPEQLEQVVCGDDLIRIARAVYGDDLDPMNWRGDSTNSGTCCAGSAACDECLDCGSHCYACCACAVCTASRDKLVPAHRAWSKAEQERSAADHAINHARWALEQKITDKEQLLRDRRWHLSEGQRYARELEPKLRRLHQQIKACERELPTIEEELGAFRGQLPEVRANAKREQASRLPPLEASTRRAKAEYERLLAEHRAALK